MHKREREREREKRRDVVYISSEEVSLCFLSFFFLFLSRIFVDSLTLRIKKETAFPEKKEKNHAREQH